MKNNKKMFFLTETLLAVMVIAVAFIMVRERNGKEQDKISVIDVYKRQVYSNSHCKACSAADL